MFEKSLNLQEFNINLVHFLKFIPSVKKFTSDKLFPDKSNVFRLYYIFSNLMFSKKLFSSFFFTIKFIFRIVIFSKLALFF
jgi:hypothetical protein